MSGDLFEKSFLSDLLSELRSYTIKSKTRRLNLPSPGTLVRVRTFVSLSTMTSNGDGGASFFQYRDSMLIVVFVDTVPHMRKRGRHINIVDPVEIIFLTQAGQLATTGIRAGADIMAPFEALCS